MAHKEREEDKIVYLNERKLMDYFFFHFFIFIKEENIYACIYKGRKNEREKTKIIIDCCTTQQVLKVFCM